MVSLRAKYQLANYDIKIDFDATMADLANELYVLTGVPVSGQKLICGGKQLPKESTVTIKQSGLTQGSKIMVLGKKYDPEQDAMYKQIVEVEKKCIEVEKRLAGIEEEVGGITRGHLDRTLHAQALKTLEKRTKGSNDELMGMMETLDGISLTEEQQDCRSKRKSVIGRINKALDQDDRLLQKLSDLIKNGVP